MEIVRQLDPTKVVVAWDSKSSTAKRKAVFPDYKAGRTKPGEDFYAQIPLLEELVLALGWGFVECDDYEADDIIGTLALQADEEGDYDTYIVSSDLDMLQVVDDNTRMFRILKGFSKLEELDVAAVEAKYGIKKAQFLDLKALKGDSSDNIPGVPGVGEKTAVKLLNQYETLDGVYEHLDEITGSTRKKLEEGKDSAKMSYFLAKIMTDAPVKLADMPDLEIDKDRIVASLKKLEFRSLVGKFMKEKLDSKAPAPKKEKASSQQTGFNLSQQTLEIPRYLEDGTLISWNVKELMHKNIEVAEKILGGGKFWDLGQGSFLLDPLARNVEYGDEMAEYERQKAEFSKLSGLNTIFTQFDLPLIPVLYQMEQIGMLIDREYFQGMKVEFSTEVNKIEHKIWSMAGQEFNINSPVQLSEILFTKLNLPTKVSKRRSVDILLASRNLIN